MAKWKIFCKPHRRNSKRWKKIWENHTKSYENVQNGTKRYKMVKIHAKLGKNSWKKSWGVFKPVWHRHHKSPLSWKKKPTNSKNSKKSKDWWSSQCLLYKILLFRHRIQSFNLNSIKICNKKYDINQSKNFENNFQILGRKKRGLFVYLAVCESCCWYVLICRVSALTNQLW